MSIKPVSDEVFEQRLPLHFKRGMGDADAPAAARWATPRELDGERWQWQPGAWFLGYRHGKAIGRLDDRHLLLAAGSRGGKGVSIIIPNCLLWSGSLLAIDPKGELARKTAGHRHRNGQRVVILDPFKVSGHTVTHSFNPLAELPTDDPEAPDRLARIGEATDRAALLAEGLVQQTHTDSHWSDAARQLVKGLILFTLTLPEPERNLLTVRELLMLSSPLIDEVLIGEDEEPPSRLMRLWLLLQGCWAFDGIVRGIGASFGSKPSREVGSILSTAQTQTDFLDSPALAPTLRESSFRLRDLKRGKLSVYLCLPASHMGTHARWLRMVINLALAALEAEPAPENVPPVLLVLEEFNVLGHMASIATAAGQIAGFGVRMLTVLQDLTQLKAHYKDAWETFVGNAGLFVAFANADATTIEYISKKLGTVSIAVENRNQPTLQASLGGASGVSFSVQSVQLLASHEVEQAFAREHQRLLVMYAGGKPFVLRRSISQDDPRFRDLLDLPL